MMNDLETRVVQAMPGVNLEFVAAGSELIGGTLLKTDVLMYLEPGESKLYFLVTENSDGSCSVTLYDGDYAEECITEHFECSDIDNAVSILKSAVEGA